MYRFLMFIVSTNKIHPHICYVYQNMNMHKKYYISNKYPFDKTNNIIDTHSNIGKYKPIDINNTTFDFDNNYYYINNYTKQLLIKNNIIKSKWK